MRIVALICSAVFTLALVGPGWAEETMPVADAARIAAARDLMEVTGVTKQLDGMMDAMTKGFTKGAQAESGDKGKKLSEEFEAFMKKFLGYKEEMMTDFAALYAETFTAEEMKLVADFYRSGTGAKFIQMTPTLMQKGAQIGMKYSERITKEMVKPAAPK
jgi:uncharacterized protein